MEARKLHFETLQLHVGQETSDPTTDTHAVSIYQTTPYVFRGSAHTAVRFGLQDPGNIRGRLTNSTQGALEERIVVLEGGVDGLAVASEAIAVTYAIENITRSGDHIVAAKTIYEGTYNSLIHILPAYGVIATFIDSSDLLSFERAIRENTKAISVGILGNSNSDIINMDVVAAIAHEYRVPLIVDNIFGTPYLIRPIRHEANAVIHSATKFIDGHDSPLGGAIADSGRFDWSTSGKPPQLTEPDANYHGVRFVDAAGAAAYIIHIRTVLLRDTEAAISPFNAFILLQGLKTLSLRVGRRVASALKVIDSLVDHPKVTVVNHPSLPDHPDHTIYQRYFPDGAGSIFTFEVEGGTGEAQKFIDSLQILLLLTNVVDVKSLVIHPATITYSQLNVQELAEQGTRPGTVRLSIGTKHTGGITDDSRQALEKI